MPYLANFKIYKQTGSLSCWAACARSVLDYYAQKDGGDDGLSQGELVSLFGNGKATGRPEAILSPASAVRKIETLNGDEAALSQASLLFLRIQDSIARFEPVVVSMQQAGPLATIGHAVVIYGHGDSYQVMAKDPGRPTVDIVASLRDMLVNFAPYGDLVEFRSLRYYICKLIFTQKPPQMRSERLAIQGLYRNVLV